MRQTIQRLLSLALCLLLCAALLPGTVWAAEIVASGTCGENLTWTLDSDGKLTISGTGEMEDYYSYSRSPWDGKRSSVKSVEIRSGVTSIGNYAFYNCYLTSVTIPNSVTSIGYDAFSGCSSLTSVTIPDSVTRIDSFTFEGCHSLTSVTIGNSVTSIGSYAFWNCDSLTSVTIPDSVTSIIVSAFLSCSSLTTIAVNTDNSVYCDIGGVLFSKNHTVLYIYPAGKTGSYSIPNSVTNIGVGAFYYCSGLTSVTIPNSVTSIGGTAFRYCDSLTSVTIPDSVTSIGDWAFRDCSSLTSVTIPNSVISIGERAFSGCSSLTSVTIPDSVTSIRNSAFSGCSSLTSVTIPDSVTSIGNSAFSSCSSLTSVTIPNSVTSIGDSAFYECSSLTSVTIPNSVTSIGGWAFSSCTSLTDVYYTGTEAQWDAISGSGKPNKSLVHFNSVMPVLKTLRFDESRYTMTVGSTVNIGALYTSEDAPAYDDVRWKSNDSAVYAAGDTSCLNLPGDTNWILSMPIGVNKAGIYTVTLLVGDLSATTQIEAVDPGEGVGEDVSTGSEITFSPWNTGNIATAKEGTNFQLTAIIPGGANLTHVDWFMSQNGTVRSLDEEYFYASNDGVVYSIVQIKVPKAGESVQLYFQLPDGRSGSYQVNSKGEDKSYEIENDLDFPPYYVSIETGSKQHTIPPGKQDELYANAYGGPEIGYKKLTGDDRDLISSIVWTSSNPDVIAFDRKGASSITHNSAKTWGLFQHETDETDSAKVYARNAGTAVVTCAITIGGETYLGTKEVFVLSADDLALQQAVKKWNSAYGEYTKAVEKAMDKVAESGGQSASLEEMGRELQNADRAQAPSKQIVDFVPGRDQDPAVVKLVYMAVADYLSENVPESFDFGGINVSGDLTSLAKSIVDCAFRPYKRIDLDYDSGVSIHGTAMAYAQMVQISYRGTLVAYMISQPQAGIDSIMEMLNGLAELDKNLVNRAYKEGLKEIFTTDLSHCILGGVQETLKKALDDYAGAFFSSGAGNAAQILKNCIDYYSYVKSIERMSMAGSSDPFLALNVMKSLRFDYEFTSIRDAAVEKSVKSLKEAADGINNWLECKAKNEPLPRAAIEIWKLAWSFQCPVSVAVFDGSGTQIGYAGEDAIWYDAERIYIENFGDEKCVYSMGEPLSFQVTGDDYGTLNCAFTELENGELLRRVNYYDIPLREGAEINVAFTNGSITEDNLSVTLDEQTISANETFDSSESDTATVQIRCLLSDERGGEVLGGGCYVRGDAVSLQASSYEGYIFSGWMGSNGAFVSSSPVYEFTARENRLLTAVFVEDIQISDADHAVIYGVEGEKKSGGAYVSARVDPLDESSLTVYCAFYDSCGRMLETQIQETAGSDACELVFITKNTDAVLSKVFVLDDAGMPQCTCKIVELE